MSETRSFSVPVPTGGWNARDPLFSMGDTDAIRLVNLFPNTNTVDIRNGFRVHSSGLGTGAVQWLAEYAAQDGTRKLIAFANSKIYNASTLSGTATDITGTTVPTTNKWSTVNFRNKLVMVNGADTPQQYNGTAVSDATYTGSGLTATNLVHASVYKSRIYFVEKNTANIWYTGVNSITGAVTLLDVSGILQKGGYVQFTGSLTRDLGDGTDSLFVIVSSVGEVLLYSGDYPGGINWQIAGRYFLPYALGRNGGLEMGADMFLATETGLLSLSRVLSNATDPQSRSEAITFKINNAFRLAAQNYKTNYGWQITNYPRGHMMLVNVPLSESSISEQYVMNTETGAWCRFTGMNACSWCLYNEKLYFGGIDGKVYEADYGQNDNGANIAVDMKGAFNYLGDNESNKRFTLARPVMTTTDNFTFVLGLDVDFDNRQITDTVTVPGTAGTSWDTASWDSSGWNADSLYSNKWYSVSGLGRCVAPRLSGNFNGVTFSLASLDYVYEMGGIF